MSSALTTEELLAEAPSVTATPLAEAASRPAGESAAVDGAEEIEWDALIPQDWRPDLLMADYNVDALSDEDPRAIELMAKLEALWNEAPVVPELDGKRVKLPGFIVPLETDVDRVSSFLLVPYYGACIHVPPPPANQTVYVLTEPGTAYRGALFDTVWVTGELRVEPTSSELAEAGYSIKNARVTPYDMAEPAD